MLKKLSYLLQFILIYLIYLILNFLPIKTSAAIGAFLFFCLGSLTSINNIAIANCKSVFPNLKSNQIKKIIRDSWKNLGINLVELKRLNKLINDKNRVQVKGLENIKEILQNNEQAIFIGIHQSNWELILPILDRLGIKAGAIYRHLNNSYVDRLVYKFRKSSLVSNKSFYTPKGIKSAKQIIENVKNRNSFVLLVDQKDSAGEQISFFNKKVKTQIGFLKIARSYNLPIIPIRNQRLTNGSYILSFEKGFYNNNKNISDKDMMVKIHRIIEIWIKEKPSQWFWQHKRFN